MRSLADDVIIGGDREIDFRKVLEYLRSEWNVKRLLGEGGGELNEALFRAGLVNELHLTLCPRILGGRNAPTLCDGAGVMRLSEATRLELKSLKRIGTELFLVYAVSPAGRA